MVANTLNELSASEIAKGIAAQEFTAQAVMRDCLDRIAEREGELSAWASVDPRKAMEEARIRDGTPAKGVLHGVPVGIKDVVDTADYPTEMGSPIYQGHCPKYDAACVSLLRQAGAVILGKTVTCEFAGMSPGATRNPLDPSRTPGGSSSGSAAAVADHMVPIALGTQTRGSILRPASYCGIVGFKPSFGLVARGGLKFAAESLDTIGVLARTIDDAALVASVLSGYPDTDIQAPASPPIMGICRDGLETADAETVDAVEDAAARLGRSGAKVQEFSLPCDVAEFTAATKIVNDVERARATLWEWETMREFISDRMCTAIESGLATPPESYVSALRLLEDCRARLRSEFHDIDIVLAPCVDGVAPVGLDYTGNPFFQGLWTALHVPSISLPTYRGPNALPVGIQLVGKKYEDKSLLAAARWVFARLIGE